MAAVQGRQVLPFVSGDQTTTQPGATSLTTCSRLMAVVAVVLSSSVPRAAYLRSKAVVDRTAAGAMGLLGLRLVATAHTA